jgi:hypothetical protein
MAKNKNSLFAVAHPDDIEVMLGHAARRAKRAFASVATLGEFGIDMLDPARRRFCPVRV